MLRAYQTLDTNEVEPDVNITQDKGWAFGTLAPDQMNVYTISVSARCRLIATLTWQRRISGVTAIRMLLTGRMYAYLADLDMIVYAPNGPNAIFSEEIFHLDPNDNLEKCDILLTAPGDYTVVIDNNSTNSETANYGFAFELHPIMAGDINEVDYIVDMNDLVMLMQDWLADDSEFDCILAPNGIIDFADFAKLADNWLQIDPFYYQF